MQYFTLIFLFLVAMVGRASFCNKNSDTRLSNKNTEHTNSKMEYKMIIRSNAQSFTATLLDNKAAEAFKALLPMTMEMIELNGNEKYDTLPSSLPTHAANPGTIQNGDLMLYGSSTLVLFYKTFETSYSYTKLGRVEDVSKLAAALGSGNVTVTFELQ